MIKQTIADNDIMVERSLFKLFARQTSDEQHSHMTKHTNGRGFNGVDASFLTSLVEWMNKSHKPEGSRLSPKQLMIARKKLMKYSAQLLEEIKAP